MEKEKSKGIAYLLWLVSIFGWLGFHRFYLDKRGTGVVWILTGGVIFWGALYDLIMIPKMVDNYNLTQTIKKFDTINISKRHFNKLIEFGVPKFKVVRLLPDYESRENDLVWSLYNELISENALNNNKLSQIYFSMAYFLLEEGKDPGKMTELAHKHSLLSYSEAKYVNGVEVIGTKDCKASVKLDGKTFKIQDALKNPPLPIKNCERDICVCTYAAANIR